ncbi:putative cytochrome oxidase subunit (partial) [Erwinia amylovora ATCC 49946]|nr:putative cytochrome oxidase subunit (partial) [Erwinia amylovora ATCC 49946]
MLMHAIVKALVCEMKGNIFHFFFQIKSFYTHFVTLVALFTSFSI